MNILPFADDPFIVTWKYSHRIPNYDTYLWSTQEYILHFYNRESRKKQQHLFLPLLLLHGVGSNIENHRHRGGYPLDTFVSPIPARTQGSQQGSSKRRPGWFVEVGNQSSDGGGGVSIQSIYIYIYNYIIWYIYLQFKIDTWQFWW